RHALGLVEQKLGPKDPAAVEPLRALAESYTQEVYYSTLGIPTQGPRMPTSADGVSNESKSINPRYLGDEGADMLERATKILEAQPPSAHDTLVQTLIQTGDWYQIKHQPEKALPYYRRAAAVKVTTPASEPAPLSFPVRVYYPSPTRMTKTMLLPAEQVNERFVEVQFTVTDTGEVSDAKVTGASGTPREISETLQAIRAARFRPKFVNGEPVATTGMTNREVFRTRKETADGGR
ncbi:MAG TPA: TonB family protein, partial [Steroidobacteraceae bacterium]|nr:TonB family protein [Steroidobacteraceae bacterium]